VDKCKPLPQGPILGSIPVVECAEGTVKYVQVQLTHPAEPGAVLVAGAYTCSR